MLLLSAVCAFAQGPQPPFHRTDIYFHRLLGPQALVETLPGWAWGQARNSPREWGRGADGAARRLGSQAAQFAVRETITLGVGAARHEDPFFQRKGEGTTGARVKHVLASGLFTRSVIDGHRMVNVSGLSAVYGGRAVASAWLPPDHRGADRVALYGSLSLGLRVAGNAFREFWPDVRAGLKKRKAGGPRAGQ